MTVCSVKDCGANTLTKEIGFFGFPNKDIYPDQWKIWVNFVGRTDWNPGANSKICSLHFDGSQTYEVNGRLRLKKNAIPNVQLVDSDDEMEISCEPVAGNNESSLVRLVIRDKVVLLDVMKL